MSLFSHRRRKKQQKEDKELFEAFDGENEETAEVTAGRAAEEAVQNDIKKPYVKVGDPDDPVDQVRSFAEMNPEIIASMISTWLKEDKR